MDERELREENTIERIHMKKQRTSIYTALEEFDFHWDLSDIKVFDQMWNDGKSFEEIVEHFNRDYDEVGILLIDRARKGNVKKRFRGLEGNG